MFTSILLGSESDKEHAKKIAQWLDKFSIPYEMKVFSAHKVPELLLDYVHAKNKEKDVVYITIAGRSNGLSGVTAGSSVHPVIACPPFKDKNDYMVNIHSSLQMPSDTPVMTVLDPQNAALCAARIFGLSHAETRNKISERLVEVKKSFKK